MLRIFGIIALLLSFTGCSNFSYYTQAIGGHLSVSSQRQPITKLLASPDTPQRLKSQLEKINALRQFAEQQLQLPSNGNYSHYADLQRRYVVWNVFAAPALSLQPKTWCYPIVGCASYRGYYAKTKAESYASKLKGEGMDVYVAGISAYSTLGWFQDPVLNTFIYRSDAQLANLVFHELAHQKLYVKNDTQFNESFATVVAHEGVKRWLLSQNNAPAYQAFIEHQQKQQQFIDLVLGYREKLAALYASQLSDEQKHLEKAQLINNLRGAHQQLKKQWGGKSDYDAWFSKDLNNAQLNTVATYFDLVPALAALLAENHSDLMAFYNACLELKNLTIEERNRQLGLILI